MAQPGLFSAGDILQKMTGRLNLRISNISSLRSITWTTFFLALAVWIFFDFSKHNPTLAGAGVFLEDPFDAVGSFGVELAVFCAFLGVLRIIQQPANPHGTSRIGLILRADLVSVLACAVTLCSDWIAMIRFMQTWKSQQAGWLLAGLTGGLLILCILALTWLTRVAHSYGLAGGSFGWMNAGFVVMLSALVLAYYPASWRDNVPGAIFTVLVGMACMFGVSAALAKTLLTDPLEPYQDILDDLGLIFSRLGNRVELLGKTFRGIEKLANRSAPMAIISFINPRRHPWNLAVLIAIAMGLLVLGAESVVEGGPERGKILLVAGVFIGLEGAGVLVGYGLFRDFLGLFHHERSHC